jgi:integrase/recombinase XerD
MNESASHSVLYPFILRYIALKQALGRGYAREKTILLSLDRFLATAGEHDLDARNFAAWCRSKQHLSSGVLRDHMRIVRNLCQYRRRTESGCFVPDKHLFPDPHPPIQPYIFSYPKKIGVRTQFSLIYLFNTRQ